VTEPVGGPVAGRGSPPPPPGRYDLRSRPDSPVTVVIDTGVLFDGNTRLPLVASARGGHLVVYWSPSIQREMAKVAYRAAILAAFRTASPELAEGEIRALLWQVFDRIAADIERQCAELDLWFKSASELTTVDEALLRDVPDIADRPVLRTALAARAPYLLSLDQRHFPHGTVYHGVQCWHPDAFLTLFYQQNPAAYEYAARSVNGLPESIKRRLLP
jgi:predicted nucleic acid-binding protein